MSVLGNNGQPGFAYFAYGGSSQPNQNAELLTNDTGSAISVVTLGAWVGGWNATARVRLCLWRSDGVLLGQSAEFVIANEGAAALGNVSQYEVNLGTPIVVNNGISFYVGVSRNRNDAAQYSTGGTVNDHIEATGPYPSGDLGELGTATVARRTGMYVANYLPALVSHSQSFLMGSAGQGAAIVKKKIIFTGPSGSTPGRKLDAIVERKVIFTGPSGPTPGRFLNAIVEKKVTFTGPSGPTPGRKLDAIVERKITFTGPTAKLLDAVVKRKITFTGVTAKLLDAVIKQNVAATATLDAIVKVSPSPSATLNAWVRHTFGQAATLDAQVALVLVPTWTTPFNGAAMSATPTLAFLIPFSVKAMHFQIELDVADMSEGDLSPSYRLYDSSLTQTGWQYWNGSSWVAVPAGGVPTTYIGNEARFTVPVALAAGFWFRRVRAGVEWP